MISISWQELAFAIINFVVLLLILKKFLYRPFLTLMDERKEGIETALAEAAAARAETASAQATIEKLLAQARVDAQALIEAAQEKAEARKTQILTEAREEAEKINLRAKEEIARDQARALQELKEELAGLIVLSTGKLLYEELDDQRQRHLTQKVMEQISHLQ